MENFKEATHDCLAVEEKNINHEIISYENTSSSFMCQSYSEEYHECFHLNRRGTTHRKAANFIDWRSLHQFFQWK